MYHAEYDLVTEESAPWSTEPIESCYSGETEERETYAEAERDYDALRKMLETATETGGAWSVRIVRDGRVLLETRREKAK